MKFKFIAGFLFIGASQMAVANNNLPIFQASETRGLETPTLEILDSDQDGIENQSDQCLSTPFGAVVDDQGCRICPEGSEKDELGCFLMAADELVIPINIHFQTASDEIGAADFRELRRVAGLLRQHQTASIVIEGHTDNVGSEDYNQSLAERRASSVKDALASLGVADEGIENLQVVGHGEALPLTTNETEEGRLTNRRVQAVVALEVRERKYVE